MLPSSARRRPRLSALPTAPARPPAQRPSSSQLPTRLCLPPRADDQLGLLEGLIAGGERVPLHLEQVEILKANVEVRTSPA